MAAANLRTPQGRSLTCKKGAPLLQSLPRQLSPAPGLLAPPSRGVTISPAGLPVRPRRPKQPRARTLQGARCVLQAPPTDTGPAPGSGSLVQLGWPEQVAPGRIVFVVNPTGAGGSALRQWQSIRGLVAGALGDSFQVEEELTEYSGHAAELAQQAAESGASVVVAVGGDGTAHEVANGLYRASEAAFAIPGAPARATATAMGVLPLGTGCDLAKTFGWKPNDPEDSARRLVQGRVRAVDLGRAQLPQSGVDCVFLNLASAHLSASVTAGAVRFKALGPLCYTLSVLTEFPVHRNRDLLIRVDSGEWELLPQTTMLAVGNGRFFGGGMQITPMADPTSGTLQMVTLLGFELKDFLLQGLSLFQGEHLSIPGISSRMVRSLEIQDPAGQATDRPVRVEVDGECLGALPAKFSVLPRALRLII